MKGKSLHEEMDIVTAQTCPFRFKRATQFWMFC